MRRLFKIIICIMLLVILFNLIYSKYILKNRFISLGGYRFLIVLTGSMEPEIKIGEFLIIKECSNYNIGEIITYEDNNYLTTHRIVKQNSQGIITKGDSNNTNDLLINENQILGKVIYHSEAIGFFIINYLKKMIIIIIITIILINVFCILIRRRQ